MAPACATVCGLALESATSRLLVLNSVFLTDDLTAIAADVFFQQLGTTCNMRKDDQSFAAAAVHAQARLIIGEAELAFFDLAPSHCMAQISKRWRGPP